MADVNAFETKHFVEAALLASPEPLSIDQLQRVASARPGAGETPKSEDRKSVV